MSWLPWESVGGQLIISLRSEPWHADRHDTRWSPNPMSAPKTAGAVPALAQPVAAPLTRAAIFLVVTLSPGADSRATLRSFCADLAGLLRAVEFRDLEGRLSCVMGFGSEAWDRLFGSPRPAEQIGR